MELTFGCELEWADVDKRIAIPAHLGSWDWKDYTIVNSDGHANDPTGKSWHYGGEINTKPTMTIEDQVAIVDALDDLLQPTVNHTCALHIHIAYEPLVKDIALLHKFFEYMLRNQDDFYKMAFRAFPKISGSQAEIKAAAAFMNGKKKRSIGKLPANRIAEIREATTPQEFYEAHAPFSDKTNRRIWHLSARSGINMKSLWKHGTVEFRCFAGSHDPEAIGNAFKLCTAFFVHALTDHMPMREIIPPKKLPVLPEFNWQLEQGFQATAYKGK